jgi:hypothetical protein
MKRIWTRRFIPATYAVIFGLIALVFAVVFNPTLSPKVFSIPLTFQNELDTGSISTDLRATFQAAGISLPPDNPTVLAEDKGREWLIIDENNDNYIVKREAEKLDVYRQVGVMRFSFLKTVPSLPLFDIISLLCLMILILLIAAFNVMATIFYIILHS